MMYSRTTSALFAIIVCMSAFWNVKATTTGMSTTEGLSHSVALKSTTTLPPDTTAITRRETTPSTVLNTSPNSTFNHNSTADVHFTGQPLVTTPSPTKSTPESGSTTVASTSFRSSVTVPKTEHVNSTVNGSTTALSTVATSETRHVTSTATSTANKSNNTTTAIPTHETPIPEDNVTVTYPVEQNTSLESEKIGSGMKFSETVLTSIFSTILVVVMLTTVAFCFNKYRKRRSQYSHHPLHETVYESEGYSPPDDTLVISGGLYDAPRIYNPNMTVLEEDESQPDYVSFSNRPGQFRLEFLPGDKDTDSTYSGSLRRNV
ncbi:uncharacterized protein RB166_002666 isoform 1-T3 [Leptodactylus fuscus]|uniref:uncharacterized protein LOC142194816 n=1 Tax=Leptodactylus fuscus TaxID=238119 RepID=UPI003F4E8E10